jgi:hypothetical protein
MFNDHWSADASGAERCLFVVKPVSLLTNVL